MRKPTVSAIVLTYNEEKHIRGCLESLTWCDEIWIVDSYSTDRTLEIARNYTENIIQHPFESFAKQRNWAMDLPINAEWILIQDADERMPKELQAEILSRLELDGNKYSGYYIPKRQRYYGRYLRFGSAWPGYEMKLFRREVGGRCPEERLVHENMTVLGRKGFLKNAIDHIAYDNLSEQLERVNHYTSLEAQRMFRTGQELYTTATVSYNWKNQVLKFIFKYLPFKPLMRFLFSYFILQGFRDGHEGYVRAVMESFYVLVSYAKLWELKNGITEE